MSVKNQEIDSIRKIAEKNQNDLNSNKRNPNMKNRKKESGKHILAIGIIIITIGMIIILSSIIFKAYYTGRYTDVFKTKISDVIDQLLMCTGTTLITIGAATALYSYFDFVNYVQEKIKDVIIDYNFTDILSDVQKKNLARKLEKELLHQNTDNNLYDFVQEEVLTLAKQAYYEEFTLNVSCKKVGNEIHKTIYKDYIINCDSQPDFDIAANNEFSIKYKGSCSNAPADSIKLSINSIDFTKDDYSTDEKDTNDEVYNKNCKYTLNNIAKDKIEKMKLDNWDFRYYVKSEMLSIVKDDDMSFSFRLYYPCKNTTFLFTYNPEEFEVMEDVFVFKDFDIDDNTKKKSIITQHNKGSIFIKIDNWVLPGDGITFVLSPISNNTKNEIKNKKSKNKKNK